MRRSGIGYPLHWPKDRPRSKVSDREGPFFVSMGEAIDHLLDELRKMGADHVIISCNARGRQTDLGWRPLVRDTNPSDPGVAVWFIKDNEKHCITCDRWPHLTDNIRSIGKTVESLRAVKRWGSSEMASRAVSGFRAALPPAGSDWKSILGAGVTTVADAKKSFRMLAAKAHPDHGGNPAEMQRLNEALAAAKAELD
jgi:hypothetical protein